MPTFDSNYETIYRKLFYTDLKFSGEIFLTFENISFFRLIYFVVRIAEEQNKGPSAKLRPARTLHELQILRSRNEVGRLHNFDPMQPSARPVQPRPTQPRAAQLRPAQVNPAQPSNIVPGMNQTRPPLQTPNAFSNPGNGFAETMKALSIQSPEEVCHLMRLLKENQTRWQISNEMKKFLQNYPVYMEI